MLFLKRLAEEAVHAFVAGFAGVAVTGDLDKAGLVAAVVVGFRAVLGVLAKNFGPDKDKPSIGA
jgi:hypothetical protein